MATKRTNGSGTLTKRGDSWRARWTTPHGIRKTKTLGKLTKAEAERQLRELLAEAEKQQPRRSVKAKPGRIRFGEFAQNYIDLREPDISRGTHANWVSMNRTTLSDLANLWLDEIDQYTIPEIAKTLGVSIATIYRLTMARASAR